MLTFYANYYPETSALAQIAMFGFVPLIPFKIAYLMRLHFLYKTLFSMYVVCCFLIINLIQEKKNLCLFYIPQ